MLCNKKMKDQRTVYTPFNRKLNSENTKFQMHKDDFLPQSENEQTDLAADLSLQADSSSQQFVVNPEDEPATFLSLSEPAWSVSHLGEFYNPRLTG